MADILFVHNNFPGQIGFVADALAAKGHRCAVIGSRTARSQTLPVRRWSLSRGTTAGLPPLAIRAEADLLRGRAAADCALAFKAQGFRPELVVGHPGWGETLFLGEVFPEARQLLYGELFYRARGNSVGFDPEFGMPNLEKSFLVHSKNAGLALAYAKADRIVCPTPFQASTFPALLRDRMEIIPEGVDTEKVRPRPGAVLALESGRVLDGRTPVITFINRAFEPLRGFHVFMRALPDLLARAPDAEIVLVGGEGVTYSGGSDLTSWPGRLMAEVGDRLDPARVHFVGSLPYDKLIDVLSISWAHVYYTYPFVASWSLLDAMAAGCLVIGSDTPPVRDFVDHGETGLLLDFFDVQGLSEMLVQACREPERFTGLRKAARAKMADRYDRRRVCLPAWLDLVERVRSGAAEETGNPRRMPVETSET